MPKSGAETARLWGPFIAALFTPPGDDDARQVVRALEGKWRLRPAARRELAALVQEHVKYPGTPAPSWCGTLAPVLGDIFWLLVLWAHVVNGDPPPPELRSLPTRSQIDSAFEMLGAEARGHKLVRDWSKRRLEEPMAVTVSPEVVDVLGKMWVEYRVARLRGAAADCANFNWARELDDIDLAPLMRKSGRTKEQITKAVLSPTVLQALAKPSESKGPVRAADEALRLLGLPYGSHLERLVRAYRRRTEVRTQALFDATRGD